MQEMNIQPVLLSLGPQFPGPFPGGKDLRVAKMPRTATATQTWQAWLNGPVGLTQYVH